MGSEVTFSPDPATPIEVSVNDNLNIIISASQTGTIPPEPLPVVVSVSLSYDKTSDQMIWTNGASATITGTIFCDIFGHIAEYVSCGKSNQQEVSKHNGIRHPDILAGDKEIFNFSTINSNDIVINVVATAHLDDASSVTANYTINVTNDTATLGAWIQDYLANKPAECP